MVKVGKFYRNYVVMITIIFCVNAYLYLIFNSHKTNFYKAWENSNNIVYYDIFLDYTIRMYMTLILTITVILPLISVIYLKYLKKKNNLQHFEFIKHYFLILIGIVIALFSIYFSIQYDISMLENITALSLPIFAVIYISKTVTLLKVIDNYVQVN